MTDTLKDDFKALGLKFELAKLSWNVSLNDAELSMIKSETRPLIIQGSIFNLDKKLSLLSSSNEAKRLGKIWVDYLPHNEGTSKRETQSAKEKQEYVGPGQSLQRIEELLTFGVIIEVDTAGSMLLTNWPK